MADLRDEVIDALDYWTPLTLRLCADAGVIEALGRDERSVADVAADLGLHAETLGRMVRLLAGRGVFEGCGGDRFRLGRVGRLLLADEPGNLAGLLNFPPWYFHAWAEARHTLRTGEPAFEQHYGQDMFGWLAAHPAAASAFNDDMRRRTSTLLDGALALYDWPATGTVVDVGGGTGQLLSGVLARRPSLRGVVLDLPHVAAAAEQALARAGLAERATAVAGSFFEPLPAEHELYVLASILHDRDDDRSLEILRRCRAAMRADARLVLFEFVVGSGDGRDLAKQYDLHMLVVLGGRERTQAEWDALLAAAGLMLVRTIATPSQMRWIEAVPH